MEVERLRLSSLPMCLELWTWLKEDAEWRGDLSDAEVVTQVITNQSTGGTVLSY